MPNGSPKHILVRAPNWVGDALMMTPALSCLRTHFAEATITLLAKPSIATIFDHHPTIDRTILYETSGKHAGVIGFLSLAASLRKEKFDMAILMKPAFESALLTAFARIPVRIGYDTDFRRFLLTNPLPVKTAPIHQRDAYLEIARFSGAILVSKEMSLVLTEEEVTYAKGVLESHSISTGALIIGLFPGAAKGPAKQWLPERFAQVADHLSKEFNAKILILGGPSDLAPATAVLDNMKSKSGILILDISLREMMAILSLCDFCITNDSGPIHLAAALGVPHLGIYGPRPPAFSFPETSFSEYVYHAVLCSPCDFRVCPIGHDCMMGVSVSEVLEKATKLIK
ncbi:MAG: lipopolysaccharide heptosyltransferase II [Nitrospirota bacterium]